MSTSPAQRVPFLLALLVIGTTCAKKDTGPTHPFSAALGVVGVATATAQVGAAFAGSNPNGSESLSAVKSAIATQLAVTDAETCLASAFAISAPTPTLSTCYGTILSYLHHPDGADFNCATLGTPCFDYGDVGVWSADATSGEACGVEKLNSTVRLGAGVINGSLKTIAALACAANALNLHVPAVAGDPLDLANVINQLVSGANLSAASFSQLQPRSGAISTWQTRLNGTVAGTTIKLTLLHSALNSANTWFAGHLFGVIGTASGTTAFSFTYRQTASQLDLQTKFGDPASANDEPFDVDNELDFSAPEMSGRSGFYALSRLDPTSGLGTTYAAWMDDLSVSSSRVFQATTAAGLSADVGVAYFGFGAPLTAGSRGLIQKMICNWGGPGANYNGLAGKAEGQKLVRNASGLLTASQNEITYAPTNSCAYTPGNFELSVAPAATAPLGAVVPVLSVFDSSTGTGDLGDIPVLSEPAY